MSARAPDRTAEADKVATAEADRVKPSAAAIALRVWRMEVGVWLSLVRFVFRRPRVPAGAEAFNYHSPVMTVLIVFIVLSAVEIPIIDLIAHPVPWIRFPLLALGIWGLTWMLGYLCGFLTRPHAVGPEGIRARFGAEIDVDLPWEQIASVERSRDVKEKAPRVAEGTLALRMQNETNILITLEGPTDVPLTDRRYDVEKVRIWVDDPAAFLDAVRRHIP